VRDELEEPNDDITNRPKSPQTVTTAGIIWIVVGSLILLNGLVTLLLALTIPAPGKGGAARNPATDVVIGLASGMLCLGLFGAVFLHVGIQTVRGAAQDSLGNGIGSIAFGILDLGVTVFLAFAKRIIESGISFVFACALLTAGVLALVGRAEYQTWRRFQKAARNAREAAWWGLKPPLNPPDE
jgi:hypothetical protein